MNTYKLVVLGLVVVVVLGGVYMLSSGGSPAPSGASTVGSASTTSGNVDTQGGTQRVAITAKSGYSPKISTAKAGIPTKLIMKTDGTYDCSSSVNIRSLNIQKTLPATGETEIDLGTPKAGDTIVGLCSMAMYNFTVKFE